MKVIITQLVKNSFLHHLHSFSIHYCVHKIPHLDPNLSHMNPVHTHFFKIHLNISPNWSLPCKFSNLNFVCISFSQYVLHALPISLFFISSPLIIFADQIQIWSYLLPSSLQPPVTSSLLHPISAQHPVLKHHHLCSSLTVSNQFQTHAR
jgi:hypothetical protein